MGVTPIPATNFGNRSSVHQLDASASHKNQRKFYDNRPVPHVLVLSKINANKTSPRTSSRIVREIGCYAAHKLEIAREENQLGQPNPLAHLNTDLFTINERKFMKPVIRYQSQLLYRRAYKPVRTIRFRPFWKTSGTFRPIKLDPKRRNT